MNLPPPYTRLDEELKNNNGAGRRPSPLISLPLERKTILSLQWERAGERVVKKAFTLAEVLITLVIIGIIAAITVQTLIQNTKKKEVETKLKQSYSILNQVVKRAIVDNGQITDWDFPKETPVKKDKAEKFLKMYFIPYLNSKVKQGYWDEHWISTNYTVYKLEFYNGTQWVLGIIPNKYNDSIKMLHVYVDINGDKNPNENGKDKFYFYIVSEKASHYNYGSGDIMRNITKPGVYYDGYGYDKNTLLTQTYRGCGVQGDYFQGAFCIALIVNNGFKIPDDYPLKL